MKIAVAFLISCTSYVLGARVRGVPESSPILQQQDPVVGYPIEGVPILPENLDFAAGLQTSDFVFDVHPTKTSREPNQGEGGTTNGRESLNTPALQGQGIALSLFTLRPGGQNLIHYHPRATELLLVFQGEIEVGFTDTQGQLHLNNVRAGQATIFPRGMLHFQRNIGTGQAEYISILNSENPGVMSFPRVLLGLPDHILAQAFRTPESTIADLKTRLLPPSLSAGGVNPNYDGAAGPNGNAPVPALGGEPASPSGGAGNYSSTESAGDLKAYLEKILEQLKAQG